MESQGQPDTVEVPYDDVDLNKRNLSKQVTRDSDGAYSQGIFANTYRGTWAIPQSAISPHVGPSTSEFDPRLVTIKELRVFNKRQTSWQQVMNELFHKIGTWCRLNHTNIVPFYGYTIDLDGRVGLVSQWCDFGSLSQYLEDYPEASRKDLALDVAEGIAYLHGHSPPIIHADLKGTNILVNKYGIACISDSGLSAFVSDVCVQTGIATATDLQGRSVRWMAPELFQGVEPRKTVETDMYAFGGVLLEIFCRKEPYHYLTSDSLAQDVIMQEEPPLREMYDPSGDDDTYWNFVQCLWNPDASIRPSAQAMVSSLFASFYLRPRQDETQARRPKVAILDGSLHKCGEAIVVESSPDFICSISLSPDGKVYCQEVQCEETGSEMLFLDLSGDVPEIFWSVLVDGHYSMHHAWNPSSSIVVFLTVLQTPTARDQILLTSANIHTKVTTDKYIDLPPFDWRIDTARFTSENRLTFAISLWAQDVSPIQMYTLSDDLKVLQTSMLEPKPEPTGEDHHNWKITKITPHGALTSGRKDTFDILESSGHTVELSVSHDLHHPPAPGRLHMWITGIQDVMYLDLSEDSVCQHIFYRLSIDPPTHDDSLQERYSLSKMDLCLPHRAITASAAYDDWFACMLAGIGVLIWHGSATLPVVTLDLGVPQSTEEELALKLVVCEGVATIAIMCWKPEDDHHLARFYRVPLPNFD